MDGAKCITDTAETLCNESSGKQAYCMRRSFHVSEDGACISDHPGDSRI